MRNALLIAALVAASIVPAVAQTTSPNPMPPAAPAASPSSVPSGAPKPEATTLSEFVRARIDTMLRTGHADAAWFSASFLAQVPAAQIDTVLAQLKTSLGEYKGIDGTQGDYTARFEKGTDEVLVHLDADNKIDALFLKPPKLQTSSLDDALRALRSSTGILTRRSR
jgi:hypothetical protein